MTARGPADDGPPRAVRLGIDVGGTFTDAVLWSERTAGIEVAKVASTPGRFVDGVCAAAAEVLGRAGLQPRDVTHVVHGSTVAANVVHERRGARVGLITTRGFRDVLDLQRQRRDHLYDLFYEKPVPVVPRRLRREVPERLDAQGRVVVPLDESAVRRAARFFRKEGCQAVAVVFLFSFLNPTHERRAAAVVREEFPAAFISLSSIVNPEFREYERTSTTVVDAFIKPEVTAYYEELDRRLRARGFEAPLSIVQSGGGVMLSRDAALRPVHTVESGPAAGAIAAAHLAQRLGLARAIAFDMGGTTAKACLIEGGRLKTENVLRVDRHPIRVPVIDLVEISGGGGTIASVDGAGLLRLGPQSTGAFPGPACYGRGGHEPTICDAVASLGLLDARRELAGGLRLDVCLARRALEALGRRIGRAEPEVASGIVRLANAQMAGAIRVVTTQRGIDPAGCTMIAFGGAGPIHAAFVARELGIPRVIVPPAPGNFNALGTLVADMRYDYMTTFLRPLAQLVSAELAEAGAALRTQALAELAGFGRSALQEVSFTLQADARYTGQAFELTVPVPPEAPRALDWRERIAASFHEAHQARYRFSAPAAPVELVALRLTAWLKTPGAVVLGAPGAVPYRPASPPQGEAGSGHFLGEEGWVPATIYRREALGRGCRLLGPAIVAEYGATTVVPQGCAAEVDRDGQLVLEMGTRGGPR